MIGPVFTAAILLAGTPVASTVTPAPSLAPSAASPAADQQVQVAPAPVAQTEPPPMAQAPAQTNPAAETETAPTASVGDIVVQARRSTPGDPLQAVNAKSFAMTQDVDRAVIGPAALAYKRTVPEPIRDGLRNFNLNLHEPVVFLNYLLQLKPGKASETVGRFAVNSTLGVAGLFDVARKRPFHLPRRPNGFGDTLGYYGVGPGPFFFLPLIGPTTLRDFVGGGVDRLVLPLGVRGPFHSVAYTVPMGADRLLDRRAEFDEQLTAVRATADPYTARRELYLHKRQAEIDALHGKHPGTGDPGSSPNSTPATIGDTPSSVPPPDTPPGVAGTDRLQ